MQTLCFVIAVLRDFAKINSIHKWKPKKFTFCCNVWMAHTTQLLRGCVCQVDELGVLGLSSLLVDTGLLASKL